MLTFIARLILSKFRVYPLPSNIPTNHKQIQTYSSQCNAQLQRKKKYDKLTKKAHSTALYKKVLKQKQNEERLRKELERKEKMQREHREKQQKLQDEQRRQQREREMKKLITSSKSINNSPIQPLSYYHHLHRQQSHIFDLVLAIYQTVTLLRNMVLV